MANYLQDILRLNGGDNVSGIVAIQLARKADFVSIPAPVGGTIYNNIVFKSGSSWNTWQVTLETPRITTRENTTREGSSKRKTLEFSIPKDRDTIRNMLALAERDEFIVLFKDANGKQKIFGSLQAPVRFEFGHDSGAQRGERNAYSCRFFYDGPDNEFFYNGTISAPVAGPAPAVVNFNGVPIASLAPGQTLNISSDFAFSSYFIAS